MAKPSEVVAQSIARSRGCSAPERRDRAAAVQLLHDLHAAGYVPVRSPKTVSAGDLSWVVAEAIHRRCCGDSWCEGPVEHLSAAAVAVDLLVGHIARAPGVLGGRHLVDAA